MKLLVLGGTVFVGRHVVETAVARGHEVTLFNRGMTNPDLFPDLEFLEGDRDGDLDALRERTWDAVIDTSGELPQQVWDTAQLLAEAVEHYTLLSSILVYPDFSIKGLNEDSLVDMLRPGETPKAMGLSTFGALKVMSERAAEASLPGRALAVRAGLPVGLYDFTDRMAYWPRRVGQGGEVLAPGTPDRPVQFIDARDLAAWMVRMAEEREPGVFNAVGPDTVLTMEAFLETCRDVTGSDSTFTWVDDAFLLERDVRPLLDLPLWIPAEQAGTYTIDNRKAIAAGLTFRPLAETLHDVLRESEALAGNGHKANGGGRQRRAGETGMDSAQEAQLLRVWHGEVR
jgi:2'-hydroxyisoflavone reductase